MALFVSASNLSAAGAAKSLAPTTILETKNNSNYDVAYSLFLNNNFKAAEEKIYTVLKKNPQSNRFRLLAMRLEYAQKRYKIAYLQATSAVLKNADSDTRFEYGVIMFTQDDCRRAIKAFATLTADDKNASFARFYTGNCQIRQREFQLAGTNLRQAKNLPPKFERLKSKYLKQIANEKRNVQFGRLAAKPGRTTNNQGRFLLPRQGRSTDKLSRASDLEDLLDDEKRQPWGISYFPAVKYVSFNEKDEFAGTGETTSAGSGPNFTLPVNGYYYFGNNGTNSPFRFEFPFRFEYQDIQTEDINVAYRVSEDGDLLLPGDVSESVDQFYSYNLEPGVYWSPNTAIDVHLNLFYEDFFLERNSAMRRSSLGPSLGFNLTDENLTGELSARVLQVNDLRLEDDNQVYNIQNAGLKANLEFAENLSANANIDIVTHSNPTFKDMYSTRGFGQVAKGELGLELIAWEHTLLGAQTRILSQERGDTDFTPSGAYQTFGFGISAGYLYQEYFRIAAKLTFDQVSRYEQYDLITNSNAQKENPETNEMSSASGTFITYGISSRIQPTPWSFFWIEWQKINQNLKPENENVSINFSQKVPDAITKINYEFGVSKEF